MTHKLLANGVRGKELDWFRNYLSGRKQRVCIDSITSNWSPITRGVPHGSILCPLLFLIYVNDLPDAVTKCTVSLYADDTTIYCSDVDPSRVQLTLNTDLERIATWIEANGLRTRGVDIERSTTIKYLGVSIDQDLKWKSQTNKIRNKSMAALGSVRRSSILIPIYPLLQESFSIIHLSAPTWTTVQ